MDPENLENLENQPTNQNPSQDDRSSTDATLELLRQTVQETNARARSEEARRIELEERLNRLTAAANTPKPVSAEDYFANPVEILRSEIASQLEPLTRFAAEAKKNQAYVNLKSRFLADARYGPLVTKLGSHLDALMSNLEPTEQNMLNAVHSLLGQLAVSNPEIFSPAKPENPNPEIPKAPVQPPHLRPSSSPRPETRQDAPKKSYTENERRLMREAGMDEEAWEKYLNAPATLSGVKKQ